MKNYTTDIEEAGYYGYLYFDKIYIYYIINSKWSYMKLTIDSINREQIKENINLVDYIESFIEYLNNNSYFTRAEHNSYKEDFLSKEHITEISIKNINLDKKSVDFIQNNFKNITFITIYDCIINEGVNLSYFSDLQYVCIFDSKINNANFIDYFNGICLDICESTIDNYTGVLHLLCEKIHLRNVKTNYEKFFLMTSAPKVKKIEISNIENLLHEDLLFISGFYNLEEIKINAKVKNYNELMKLGELKEVNGVSLDSGEGNVNNSEIYKKLQLLNKHIDFYNKIKIDRLNLVKWQGKFSNETIGQIKETLEELKKTNNSKINEIQSKGRIDTVDESWYLRFGYEAKMEDREKFEIIDTDTGLFEYKNDGIKYYVLSKKILLPTTEK